MSKCKYIGTADNNIATSAISQKTAIYNAPANSVWWTAEMTADTTSAITAAISDNTDLTITTDHSNYIDYSRYNSIPWGEYEGNYQLNHYIYNNPAYYVLPNIYNIPTHIVLTEGTIVYATDTNTVYIYRNGRFEEMNCYGTTYTTNRFNKENITDNKQKKLVEENRLIMLYFF